MAAIAILSEVDRLHHVVETQRLVNAGILDTDGLLQAVVERACLATGADGAIVELLEETHLVSRAAHGTTDSTFGTRVPLGRTLSGLCLRQRSSLMSRDCETDPRVDAQGCLDVGLRSMIVAPLIQRGEVVGVLKAMSTRHGHFDRTDMDALELMAGCIASSLALAATPELDARSVLYDPLTGLASRLLLMDRLTQVLYEARRYGRSFGLFLIDLDGFTLIREASGHEAGNTVLQTVSRGLSATVRTGDTLARLGGDQFVIVCGNADRTVEHRIRGRIDGVFEQVSEELSLDGFGFRANIGVVWNTGEEANAEELLNSALASKYRTRSQMPEPSTTGR